MPKNQETIKVIDEELSSIKKYMRHRTTLPFPPSAVREKNARDSIRYRQKGNELYKSKNHNERIHEIIWRTYTQSIALAPNKSEELACGYGNRSALLFHLKKFKDCIKDCDKALSITKSDILKTKLLARKAECLFLLDKPTATKDTVKEAMQNLKKLQLDSEAAKSCDKKLKQISSNCSKLKGTERNHNSKLRKKYIDQLSNFPRSKEVPCASTSVAIRYNQQLGRHLVATKDVRPGEILAIEKNYYTFLNPEGMYLYCSNCAKSAWSSIPCEHCIFDVYCSESCRAEAWEKYHQWECSVYPHLWDIDEGGEGFLFVNRFALIALSEVGGIENMKKLLIELGESKDPRTAGFSEGVFDVSSVRSLYGLTKNKESYTSTERMCIQEFCNNTYFTAKYTTLFGQKMNSSVSEIFQNNDVLFFAALLLHSYHILNCNSHHIAYTRNDQENLYATTVRAFSTLINHECDPNIEVFMVKRNTTVIYARKPVKKGSQLVISYCGKNFLKRPKEFRQQFVQKLFKFTCKCTACTENWSSICLPTVETIEKLTPELRGTYSKIMDKMSGVKKAVKKEIIEAGKEEIMYSPKVMRDFVFCLESMAERITTHCDMYYACLECLDKMFWDVFGSFHTTIPEQCFKN